MEAGAIQCRDQARQILTQYGASGFFTGSHHDVRFPTLLVNSDIDGKSARWGDANGKFAGTLSFQEPQATQLEKLKRLVRVVPVS